jgi:hypothetical protein
MLEKFKRKALPIVRSLGGTSGLFAVDVRGNGESQKLGVRASDRGYYTPIVPAVIAAEAIFKGEFKSKGLVTPDKHTKPDELFNYLRSLNISSFGLP